DRTELPFDAPPCISGSARGPSCSRRCSTTSPGGAGCGTWRTHGAPPDAPTAPSVGRARCRARPHARRPAGVAATGAAGDRGADPRGAGRDHRSPVCAHELPDVRRARRPDADARGRRADRAPCRPGDPGPSDLTSPGPTASLHRALYVKAGLGQCAGPALSFPPLTRTGLVKDGGAPRCAQCAQRLAFGTDRLGRTTEACRCGYRAYVQVRESEPAGPAISGGPAPAGSENAGGLSGSVAPGSKRAV